MLNVKSLRLRISGLRFRVQSLGRRVLPDFRVQSLRAEWLGFTAEGFGDWSSGYTV
jgi:hypothetical protein